VEWHYRGKNDLHQNDPPKIVSALHRKESTEFQAWQARFIFNPKSGRKAIIGESTYGGFKFNVL